jgi:hypothetical protein
MTDAFPRQSQRQTDAVSGRGVGHLGFAALIVTSSAFNIVDAWWSFREFFIPAVGDPWACGRR